MNYYYIRILRLLSVLLILDRVLILDYVSDKAITYERIISKIQY
jgi:hypothetical protein